MLLESHIVFEVHTIVFDLSKNINTFHNEEDCLQNQNH